MFNDIILYFYFKSIHFQFCFSMYWTQKFECEYELEYRTSICSLIWDKSLLTNHIGIVYILYRIGIVYILESFLSASNIWDKLPSHLLSTPNQKLLRVTFKLCSLTHKCLHGSAPSYLVRYFTPVRSIVGRTHLHSAATGLLFVPRSQTSTIGPQTFAISPSEWNRLPVDLRDPRLSLMTFRRILKTYVFNPSVFLST